MSRLAVASPADRPTSSHQRETLADKGLHSAAGKGQPLGTPGEIFWLLGLGVDANVKAHRLGVLAGLSAMLVDSEMRVDVLGGSCDGQLLVRRVKCHLRWLIHGVSERPLVRSLAEGG